MGTSIGDLTADRLVGPPEFEKAEFPASISRWSAYLSEG